MCILTHSEEKKELRTSTFTLSLFCSFRVVSATIESTTIFRTHAYAHAHAHGHGHAHAYLPLLTSGCSSCTGRRGTVWPTLCCCLVWMSRCVCWPGCAARRGCWWCKPEPTRGMRCSGATKQNKRGQLIKTPEDCRHLNCFPLRSQSKQLKKLLMILLDGVRCGRILSIKVTYKQKCKMFAASKMKNDFCFGSFKR